MATRALDIMTILRSLKEFENQLNVRRWFTQDLDQLKAFKYLDEYAWRLVAVPGFESCTSQSYTELNDFLLRHGLEPVMQPFDSNDGLGVVSSIDKEPKWLHGVAEKVYIINKKSQAFFGLQLPTEGVNVYEVEGLKYCDSFLLEILTDTDETLWIFTHHDLDICGFDLVDLSIDVMSAEREIIKLLDCPEEFAYEGAQLPLLKFNIQSNINQLSGVIGIDESMSSLSLRQVFQQFKMKMNEVGPMVKSSAKIIISRAMLLRPSRFIVDKPFYGWWTKKGMSFPFGAFFADYDSFEEVK